MTLSCGITKSCDLTEHQHNVNNDHNNVVSQSADRKLIAVPLNSWMLSASGLISTSHGLSIGSLNVRSIGKKVAAVCDILASSNLDVLVLQETWHEYADLVSLRRAAPPAYSVIEEARWPTATR